MLIKQEFTWIISNEERQRSICEQVISTTISVFGCLLKLKASLVPYEGTHRHLVLTTKSGCEYQHMQFELNMNIDDKPIHQRSCCINGNNSVCVTQAFASTPTNEHIPHTVKGEISVEYADPTTGNHPTGPYDMVIRNNHGLQIHVHKQMIRGERDFIGPEIGVGRMTSDTTVALACYHYSGNLMCSNIEQALEIYRYARSDCTMRDLIDKLSDKIALLLGYRTVWIVLDHIFRYKLYELLIHSRTWFVVHPPQLLSGRWERRLANQWPRARLEREICKRLHREQLRENTPAAQRELVYLREHQPD